MPRRPPASGRGVVTAMLVFALVASGAPDAQTGPFVLDDDLAVRTVVSGLNAPTALAFLGPNELLIAEKNTGRVRHVIDGAVVRTALDLAVNHASERGLLGMALHPDFASNRFVYLFWTCRAARPGGAARQPTAQTCPDPPATGADTGDVLAVPLLGHRVDRFIWTGSALMFDRNIVRLRAFQHDATNPGPAGNHNGGVLRFGPDGRLYIVVGDVGRRGQFQNLPGGPFGPGQPDDQFGGPEPGHAHFTSAVIRLADDGSTPADNPFFEAGLQIAGQAGANIRRTFAYGIRNSFGMAFDPMSGHLWIQQNGNNSFDGLYLVEAGSNLGWVQIMGPVERVAEFRSIDAGGLQQRRWPPTRIATTPEEALSRLFMLPGARYVDPQFSWRHAIPPAGIGFLSGGAWGAGYADNLFVGSAVTGLDDGFLFRFRLAPDRRGFAFDDPRLADRVADNHRRGDVTESESLRFGTHFGALTDIHTGPNGNLFVLSLTHGAVYEIHRTTPLPEAPAPPGTLPDVPVPFDLLPPEAELR